MDELLKALAEAVRAGSAFAMPALVGYYIVRATETIAPCVAFIGVVAITGRTIRAGMTIYHDKNAALWDTRRKAHEAAYNVYKISNNYSG